jgi:hypothetical protein
MSGAEAQGSMLQFDVLAVIIRYIHVLLRIFNTNHMNWIQPLMLNR